MSFAGTASEAGNAPMTIDQASDFLDSRDKEQEEQEQPVDAPEAPPTAETQNTEAAPAAEDDPRAETPTEETDAEVEAQPAPIEPPQFWSTEAKGRFRDLPRDLQEVLSAQEKNAVEYVTKTANDANETRKAADAERTRFGQLSEQLGKLIPQAEKTFADRWTNVDWVALTDQVEAEAAQKLKFQHDAEREQLASLKTAQTESEKAQFGEFIKREAAILPTICPALTDPKEGAARRQSLYKYLIEENGIPEQQISGVSARELTIAWKAQQWDLSQAKAKTLAAQKKPAAVAQPARTAASRPTVPGTSSTPANNRLQELTRKRSLSIDEATELMNLKDKEK